VVILDDVISTGESLLAVRKLLEQFDADIVAQAAILAEGDAAKRDDIIFLEELPLFWLLFYQDIYPVPPSIHLLP
jgi:adenine phosphoribosyltransferase